MAGLLEFVGDIPEYVRKAAQNKLAEKAASDARKVSVMANEGGMRPSVTKAANNALKEYAKGSLKYEGGMRESVRKAAEKVLQGGVAEAAPAAAKTGLLGKILSAPVGMATQFATMDTGDSNDPEVRYYLQNGPEATKAKRWSENNPEAAAQAQAGMEGVANRAVDAGMSAVKAGSDQYKAEAAQGKHPIFQAAVQEKATQVESQRQVVEAGAKEKLRTNQLSRPKAAEAVVKADIERSGEKVTPEEFKTRVKKEVSSMKTMDDDQLSKYLSYALIAGGLIASHLDKSGDAGRAFAGGFNAQLDRNQQMAMFKEKERAAAEAAASKAALEERKLGIQEADVNSKITKRDSDAKTAETKTTALLDKWENEARIANEKLGAYRERTAATAGGSAKSPKAPYLSFKDNSALVDSYAQGKGIELGDGVKEAMAQQLQFIQRDYPDLTVEEQMGLVTDQFKAETYDPWGPGDNQKRYQLQ